MTSRTYPCKFCGTLFSDRSNRYRHENKHCSTRTKNIIPQPRQKIEVKLRVKVNTKDENAVNEEILNELQQLRERVKKIENEPRYNNWIIIGPDMYNDMVDKYGRTEALDFLTKSAISGDSVDVIKKIYLDGISPEKYPIACKKDMHFRYLNDKREVIDDKGGESVQKMFTARAHKAMVVAANEQVREAMENSNMNDLFTKLNDVQNGLASVHSLDLERLAGITTNPDHPFFLDEGETYRD